MFSKLIILFCHVDNVFQKYEFRWEFCLSNCEFLIALIDKGLFGRCALGRANVRRSWN